MQKILLSFLILVSFKVVAQSEQQVIQDILQQQQNAWNKGDLNQFMQGYWQSEELTFVGKSGLKKGWQTTLDNYKKSYPDIAAMGELKFTILSIEVTEQTAFVLGKWSLKREQDNPNGHFTLLWKKIADQWKIVIDHSS